MTAPHRFLRRDKADHRRVRDAAKQFGAALRAARCERKYSQQAVADLAEMSQMKLVAVEQGRFGLMTIETLLVIVDRYDLRLTFEPRDAAISRAELARTVDQP